MRPSPSTVVTALIARRIPVAATLGGHRDLLESYISEKQITYAKYLDQRCFYYQSETRWQDKLFWRRRQIYEDQDSGSDLTYESL